MTNPAIAETTDRVVRAFKKIGMGGKFATYDVVDQAPYIELLKIGCKPSVCFRILTEEELFCRVPDFVQNAQRSILEVQRKTIGEEMYAAHRLVQNMHVKLYATVPKAFMYYDQKTNSMISKYGSVIIETCKRIDDDVDVTSGAAFAYLDELSNLIDECKDTKDVTLFTDMGKLHIKIEDNQYVVETDCTVDEFNGHWEKQ